MVPGVCEIACVKLWKVEGDSDAGWSMMRPAPELVE